jgi:hypothetical protein
MVASDLVSSNSPKRALRPARSLLIAGAAAIAWLALSAPGASADAGLDPDSLFGGAGSTVSAPTTLARSAAAGVPVSPPPAVPADGLLHSPAANAASIDQLLSSVPVVDQMVPAETAATVTAPIVDVADSVVGDAAGAAIPAVAGALPVLSDALPALEPIVGPVTDIVTESATPELPPLGVGQLPAPELPATAAPAVLKSAPSDDVATPESGSSPASDETLEGPPASAPSGPVSFLSSWSPGSPGNGGRAPEPSLPATVPGSVAGSGQSSGTAGGPAAWLSEVRPAIPPLGAFPVGGPLQNVPSPVSLDPGSSPD